MQMPSLLVQVHVTGDVPEPRTHGFILELALLTCSFLVLARSIAIGRFPEQSSGGLHPFY